VKKGLVFLLVAACAPSEPSWILPAPPAATTVAFDLFHKPLPEIPLPNDTATRYDPTSATGLRVNASMVAPTSMERRIREKLDQLDGWGTFQPITIPFTAPLDVGSILAGHRDPATEVVYLVNIDRDSPKLGRVEALDIGDGNYPVILERLDNYWKNDIRSDAISLMFEEIDEDKNGNGALDPGEDTDADGVLDKPNYLPGASPPANDLAARGDALMTFYEKQTHTLILRTMEPLDERTTYAVVVTRRLKDAAGEPVGSPFPGVNHAAQTETLRPLLEVLPAGLAKEDIAFTFAFTTQSVQSHWKAVRDGLYGTGAQAHLATLAPAELASVERLYDAPRPKAHLLYGEAFRPLLLEAAAEFLGLDESEMQTQKLLGSVDYIDYLLIGSYPSPQLMPRNDADGKPLPLDEQSWPGDLDRKPAPARKENIYFTLLVPRKEISARGAGKPAPLVILGHGYGSSRFEVMTLGPFMARRGFAVIAIDGPSSGLGIGTAERLFLKARFTSLGLKGLAEALLKDRAFDQDADGNVDSGADMWSAYLFHTRDMVRQFALDYSQLVRVVRSFDGTRRGLDLDGDGTPELAGDFDGDGVIDIGGDAPIFMAGGSLGGIMSMVMGGAEPELTAIAPISGGAGFLDIAVRSMQNGVPQSSMLRLMGPLYVGNLEGGTLKLATIVTNLHRASEHALGEVAGVMAGDLMVVENLENGERGCGFVTAAGAVRAGVASNVGDRTRMSFYRVGAVGRDCALPAGLTPVATFDKLGVEVRFRDHVIEAGQPVEALAEGFGLRRNDPDLRRVRDLSQMIVDPADPVSFAPGLNREPIAFAGRAPGGGAHALVITTNGDMNVPAGSGVTYARAAGIVDDRTPDPRFGGKTVNQVLLDTYTVEAVHSMGRHVDTEGNFCHIDIENFSGGDDLWGARLPRLDPPLHAGFGARDAAGGTSVAVFPMANPTGRHGFDTPGVMIDQARRACTETCAVADGCGCETRTTFDLGTFMLHMIGGYFASGGTAISADLCMSRDDCPGLPPAPPARSGI